MMHFHSMMQNNSLDAQPELLGDSQHQAVLDNPFVFKIFADSLPELILKLTQATLSTHHTQPNL